MINQKNEKKETRKKIETEKKNGLKPSTVT